MSVALTGFAILLLAFALAENGVVQRLMLNTGLLFLCMVFTGFLLPLLVLAGDWLKRRREEKRG